MRWPNASTWAIVVSPAERRQHDRLAQFLREWQAKSETSRLAEFVEYLDYFMQAGGQINLEQDAATPCS